MKIVCKECNKEFEPKQDMLKESYLGSMKTQTYFRCPHCNKKYVVCINTPKARRLMTDIKKCEALGDNAKAAKSRKELKIEMDKSNGRST